MWGLGIREKGTAFAFCPPPVTGPVYGVRTYGHYGPAASPNAGNVIQNRTRERACVGVHCGLYAEIGGIPLICCP